MSSFGEGFFYSGEDQAKQQALRRQQAYAQALMKGEHKGRFGGLANAGSDIAGALLSKRLEEKEGDLATKSQSEYMKSMAQLLGGGRQQQPMVSNTPGSAPQMDLDPEGNPEQQAQAPPQDFAARVAATNNPYLMSQFAPKIAENQMGRENKVWERGLPEAQAAKDARAGAFQNQKELATFNNQLPETAAQSADDKRADRQLGIMAQHYRNVDDAAANPFGSGVANNETGDKFLESLPPNIAGQVKAIATYRQPAPASRSRQSMALMAAVNQYRPDYDSTMFGAKNATRTAFAKGKQGDTVRSLNVAVEHLEQLSQLSQALGNGNVPVANKIGQMWAQQTGNPAPTNFDATKQIVMDEVIKGVVGAGGGVEDRRKAAENVSRAASPQQLAGVIEQVQGLLGGQLRGLKQQYSKSTGLDDFDDFLTPVTRQKLEHKAPAASQGGGGSVTAEQARAELARRRAAQGK